MLRLAPFVVLFALAGGGAGVFATRTPARLAEAPVPVTTPVAAGLSLDLARPVARTEARFLSFAVDTAQVVGGEFWAPPGRGEGVLETAAVAAYDFSRPQLRRLAAGLAPAYLRIGGTDADRTVYHVDPAAPPPQPRQAARWVLTRHRWDAVNAFARAHDLSIVFTLNAGPSARDRDGNWDPSNARQLMAYSRARNHDVAVWELGNEVSAFPIMHRTWLSAERYAADIGRARALVDELGRGAKLAGPSSPFWPLLGEVRPFQSEVLARAGRHLDVVSWHYYPQQSWRCPVATRRASFGRMLTAETLGDVERWAGQVEALARAHAPRAEVWLGETGSAQCGGEPGLSNAHVDALWWLDELGRVARRGQRVVVRQTLSGADYGLIDDATLNPNPSYWASWLWRQLMGEKVLAARSDSAGLHAYAHCARNGDGVNVLALNVGVAPIDLALPSADGARVRRLAAHSLGARTVTLEGRPLTLSTTGELPALASLGTTHVGEGRIRLPAHSAAFITLPLDAPACRN